MSGPPSRPQDQSPPPAPPNDPDHAEIPLGERTRTPARPAADSGRVPVPPDVQTRTPSHLRDSGRQAIPPSQRTRMPSHLTESGRMQIPPTTDSGRLPRPPDFTQAPSPLTASGRMRTPPLTDAGRYPAPPSDAARRLTRPLEMRDDVVEIAPPVLSRRGGIGATRTRRRWLMLSAAALAVAIVAVTLLVARTSPNGIAFIPPTAAQRLHRSLLHPTTIAWGGDPAIGAPMLFTDPQSKGPTGLDAALLKAIAGQFQLGISFQSVAWQNFPQTLRGQQIDLFASGIEVPTIPTADAIFTQPYLVISDEIIVRAGETSYTDLASLRNHVVGVVAGDRAVATVKTDPAITMRTSPILPLESLAAGRVDAVVLSSPLARWYVAHDPQHRFTILPKEYHVAPVALALAPNNAHAPDLQIALNETIQGMVADGSLFTLLKQWSIDNAIQHCLRDPATCTAG